MVNLLTVDDLLSHLGAVAVGADQRRRGHIHVLSDSKHRSGGFVTLVFTAHRPQTARGNVLFDGPRENGRYGEEDAAQRSTLELCVCV